MIEVLVIAAIVLVLAPALAALAIFVTSRLDDRDAPMVIAVGVPYLLVVGLVLLMAWPLAALL